MKSDNLCHQRNKACEDHGFGSFLKPSDEFVVVSITEVLFVTDLWNFI